MNTLDITAIPALSDNYVRAKHSPCWIICARTTFRPRRFG